MALNCNEICNINKRIKDVLKDNKTCKVLSLGYPDIIVTKDQMSSLLVNNSIDKIDMRDDLIDIAVTHNIEDLVNWCCESYSLFSVLGAELTVIDFTSWTNKEEVVDLNYPIDEKYYKQYDIVIDPGTTEHIFNIAQAMINILNITKKNGFIYHQTPYNNINHGFYNLSPTFYKDFYEENGAHLLSCKKLTSKCDSEGSSLELRETFDIGPGTNSVWIQKLLDDVNYIYPVQGKYKNNFNDSIKIDEIKKKYGKYNKIVLIPYNAHSKKLSKILKDKDTTILDDNALLSKYLNIKPTSEINKNDFDIVLITSITFETKIKNKLLSFGINTDKIFLQV